MWKSDLSVLKCVICATVEMTSDHQSGVINLSQLGPVRVKGGMTGGMEVELVDSGEEASGGKDL